jgi:hypothetical protein
MQFNLLPLFVDLLKPIVILLNIVLDLLKIVQLTPWLLMELLVMIQTVALLQVHVQKVNVQELMCFAKEFVVMEFKLQVNNVILAPIMEKQVIVVHPHVPL